MFGIIPFEKYEIVFFSVITLLLTAILFIWLLGAKIQAKLSLDYFEQTNCLIWIEKYLHPIF